MGKILSVVSCLRWGWDGGRDGHFWGKNGGGGFGKVFESWKIYKKMDETCEKLGCRARRSW